VDLYLEAAQRTDEKDRVKADDSCGYRIDERAHLERFEW
jgi:hypothetical protein